MKGESSHSSVNELLPWYANGTASTSERQVISRHLEECAECRDELAFLQEVRMAATEAADAAPAVAESLGRTFAAIDEWEAHKAPTGTTRIAAFFEQFFNPQPGLARAAFAVQFALILLLGGLLMFSRPQGGSFTTLSGTETAGGGARLTLIFEPTAPEAAMRQAMLDIGATLVSGPSAQGVYVVELQAPANETGAVEAAVETLRRNTAVIRFAERQP